MTHLEILLRFIKEMDSEMLIQILPERLSQQKVSKQVFINKLEDIFTEFKAKGDSQILINDNTCKCEDCMALDFEKRSFAFFGNISGDFFCLDFYIIENKVILIDNVQSFDLNKVIEMKNDLFEFSDLTKSNSHINIFFKDGALR
jgi:hypothetical protein